MKKNVYVIVTGFLLSIIYPQFLQAETMPLQQQIDAANKGETIHIADGTYEENIVIDKPIHLIGSNNVTLTHTNNKPIISIQVDDVVIEHLTIDHHVQEKETSTILINSNHNKLENIAIQTDTLAIQLDQANSNKLAHITITGNEDTPLSNREHGIDLWKSNNNEIHHVEVAHVKDGIYIESSKETHLYENEAAHSRYGYHLMFTKNTNVFQNESYENVSGLMVMGTNGTKVYDNVLRNNQQNVQSLGLLLFDVEEATITDNDINNNRVGIFVENASNNDISMNSIHRNFIGLQFKKANNNDIFNNSFTANVVQGQAEESSNNRTNENYWEDHLGLDTTGDNVSNLAYEVDPFFLHVSNEFPPFQLLFQSPGMIFTEELLHTPLRERLIDQAPLMENPLQSGHGEVANQLLIFLFGFILLLVSTTIIYMGVKKR